MGEHSEAFWRLCRELAILIFGTLILSSLVAPSLYVGLKSFYPELPWPYSRVFDRVAMVVAVAVFVLRRKHYNIAEYKNDFREYRRYGERNSLIPLTLGFFLSLGLSMLALPFVVAEGDLQWSGHGAGDILFRFAKSIPAALLISIIEETFFRFFLFLSLRRFLPFFGAAVLSSLLYAVVHFIQPVKSWEFTELGISTGFSYLGLLLERFTQDGLLEAALGLFLIGLVLCFTVERTRSILPAIGLHAGWVTTTKVIGRLVDASAGFEYPAGAGRRYFLLTEEVTWLAIVLVGVISYFVFTKVPKGESSND